MDDLVLKTIDAITELSEDLEASNPNCCILSVVSDGDKSYSGIAGNPMNIAISIFSGMCDSELFRDIILEASSAYNEMTMAKSKFSNNTTIS